MAKISSLDRKQGQTLFGIGGNALAGATGFESSTIGTRQRPVESTPPIRRGCPRTESQFRELFEDNGVVAQLARAKGWQSLGQEGSIPFSST